MGWINDLGQTILRSVINAAYLTKGSMLTYVEGDNNLIRFADAIKDLREGVKVNSFRFGEQDNGNVVLSFYDSTGALGVIRYNGTSKLFEFAHDGANFSVLGSSQNRTADATIVTGGAAVPVAAAINKYAVIDNQQGGAGIDVTISGAQEIVGVKYLLVIQPNSNLLNSINVTIVGGSYRPTGGGNQHLEYWVEAGQMYGVWTKNGYLISN